MATVAVGDVHGNIAALDDLLGRVLPTLTPADELVFLGDYVDRGPDARACIERLVQLRRHAPCPVVALLGNHEEWLLRTLQDPTRHSWLLGMDGLDTVASYSVEAADRLRREARDAGPRLVTERARLPYELFVAHVPPAHIAFLEGLVRSHRTPDVLCVHGGLDPGVESIEAQEPSAFTWGDETFPEAYRGPDAIVYGHRNDAVLDADGWPRPRCGENRTFGLDTIAHGVLTAMRFPDHAIFQSARHRPARQTPDRG